MRYVAGQPAFGQVGNQLTSVWFAKYVSLAFGLEYQHAPFIDQPGKKYGQATHWNAFFNIGAGQPTVAELPARTGLLTYEPWAGVDGLTAVGAFNQLQSLALAVPDGHLLQFRNYMKLNPEALLFWEQQCLVKAGTFRHTCRWFQDQLAASTVYRDALEFTGPPGQLLVAVYWRQYFPDESSETNPEFTVPRLAWLLDCLRRDTGREIAVALCSQRELPASVYKLAEHVRVIVTSGQDSTALAFKTLINAELTITSIGASSTLIGIYRAFSKFTFGQRGFLVDGYVLPETGAPVNLKV